jgi:TPR repeat protein
VTRALLAAVACAACGSTPPPAPAHHAPAPVAQVERGLDFERGRGVPRDYRKAVEIYRAACHDGCGELASCQRLFRLASGDRGIVMPGKELLALVSRLCDRHDMNACVAAVLIGARGDDVIPHVDDKDKQVEQCEAGDLAACQLTMFAASFNFGGSSTVEEREQRAAEKACTLGDPDGCNSVAEHWRNECEGKDLVTCLDALGAEDGGALAKEYAETRDIVKRAITACTDGDVDACDAVGKELPPAQLCDAGDFDACRKLAEAGDAHAKELACAAGLDAKCDVKVPRQPDARAIAGELQFLRGHCEKQHEQEMCAELAQLTAVPRCQ